MEKQTESDRIFKFDENRRLYAVDYERNIYKGTMDEAMKLSEDTLFQFKRSPETEKFFEGSEAAYCLFGKGEPLGMLGKQDVTQNVFQLEGQDMHVMNKYDVLANLREYCEHIYGTDRDEDDIIEAFGSFEENGSSTKNEIKFDKGEGNNVVVHIDVEDPTNFILNINDKGVIKSVELG